MDGSSFGVGVLTKLGVGEQAATGFLEAGVGSFGVQLSKYGCVHGGDNVAENGLTVERVIDRQRLVPAYGSGWQPPGVAEAGRRRASRRGKL